MNTRNDTFLNISGEESNKRSVTDRRKCPTPIISRYTFSGGQRKIIRREADKSEHIYVDLYSTRLLIAIMSLLLLSCLDAYLTLELIRKGSAVEVNPVMAYFLAYGTLPFTVTKFIITASSLIIMILFKNVKITRLCLPCAIKIYILIVIYEFYIFLI